MTEPLTCKVPDCGRTRANSSPDFCVQHEHEARTAANEAESEAEHLTDFAAQFEEWCAQHGKPHPYH